MSEVYYKWLKEDQTAPVGKGKWVKDRWRSVSGDLVPCQNGLHLARSKELLEYISDRLWVAEIDPSELIDDKNKIVVRRARVIKRVETITEWSLRAFAADCAEQVVELTGPDKRCVEAIRVARLFALQRANIKELAAARDAAWAARAAWDATWAARAAANAAANAAVWAAKAAANAAAWDPAMAVAWAARAAAMAASNAAAYDPAMAVAWAAMAATRAAADAATWDPARAATRGARAAASDAARDVLNARLLQYVEHGMSAMEMPRPKTPTWPVSKKKKEAA